ncbi:DUF397 domain-containing protein [Streptomyces sp. p1417]|uniref:DUF397 domain-containing protein n=1 Tax=Streptomyces typhae TaxID=2681492 RepID=A0A6L6WYU6_9ACTN|nr:DUF397 domain-containing protein [Streptomyces typhae]MVO86671.1 DUF397 domain-containing protein [Streptomyces typhae]
MVSNRERRISFPDASVLGAWRKSTYSGGDGADCLEVHDAWHKSPYSGGESGDCVEVGSAHSQVAFVPVRDSKNPHGPAVLVGAPAWQAFVTHLAG